MIASSVFIVHSSGSLATPIFLKVEPTANYEGDNEADAVGANEVMGDDTNFKFKNIEFIYLKEAEASS